VSETQSSVWTYFDQAKSKEAQSTKVANSFDFIFNRLKRAKWVQKGDVVNQDDLLAIQRYVGLVSNVVEVMTELKEKPRLVDYIHAGFRVESVLTGFFRKPNWSFFDDADKWQCPFNEQLARALSKHVKRYLVATFKDGDENDDQLVNLAEIEGVKFGWLGTDQDDICELFVEKDKVDRARVILHDLLWKSVGSDAIVLRTINDGNTPYFTADEALPLFRSELSEDLCSEISKFLDAGHHQTLLFYGPPGTGKSTMVRFIASQLKMRTIRFRVEDLPHLDNDLISACVEIFKPEAVIFDDLERSGEPAGLLETMVNFHQTVKLVMASVNKVNALSDAFIRAGRFDKLVPVMSMEPNIVKGMLKGDEELYERVKTWPVAFIQQFIQRVDVLGKEAAIKGIGDLARRVARIREGDYGFGDEEGFEEQPDLHEAAYIKRMLRQYPDMFKDVIKAGDDDDDDTSGQLHATLLTDAVKRETILRLVKNEEEFVDNGHGGDDFEGDQVD
jgi:hypothetical protein